MSEPGVSVVMPAYNAERYLREAIDSVLGQTLPPLELLVVVDEGSVDGTAAIAASYGDPVRALDAGAAPGNIGANRNRGVRESRGDVLAFIDADDRWDPLWLELGCEVLESEPHPDIVFGLALEFVSPDLGADDAARLRPLEGARPAHLCAGTLLRRDTFERIGSFGEGRSGSEFSEWFLRARDLGMKEAILDRVTLHRRLHGSNTTRVTPQVYADHLHAIKASLDRRRARGRL
jgi:glycosyltransferase involved in cell wall biosynthesis